MCGPDYGGGQVRIVVISRRTPESSPRSRVVMIVGAVGATALGALAALEFERITAIGHWLMVPAGKDAVLRAAATAGLTGFLFWVICALAVRAVSEVALNPYNALADRLDRLVDGETDDLADLHGPVVGVRRLARAIFVFHDRATASRLSELSLQARYDALYEEHANERRLLMTMLAGRVEPATPVALPSRPDAAGMSDYEIPGLPEKAMEPVDPAARPGQVINLAGRLAPSQRPTAGPDLLTSTQWGFGSLDLASAPRQ